MADDGQNNSANQNAGTPATGNVGSDNTPPDVRQHPAFLGVLSQLEESKKQTELFQSQLTELRTTQENARREAEQKRLEEEGKYKEIAENSKNELEAIRKSHALELRQRDLKTELFRAGLKNDLAIAGAISGCPDDADISAYVAEIKEKNPILFAPSEMPPASAPAQGSSSGNVGQWESIKTILEQKDKSTKEASDQYFGALKKVVDFQNKNNGKLPW